MTTPIATEETILAILEDAINHQAGADWIARYLEARHKKKPGSMHLAVKLCMRRLEANGKIIVLGPKDQWDTYTLCLRRRK